MGTEIVSPGFIIEEPIYPRLIQEREVSMTSLEILNDYLDESKYIYAIPKAAGNPDHPHVEDSDRENYYMCRKANILGAAQQIALEIRKTQKKEKTKLQGLWRCYRQLRRVADRPGLRTEGEMKIVKKDIKQAVDILSGNYIQ